MLKGSICLLITISILLCSAFVTAADTLSYSKGDVDADGEITSADYLRVKEYFLGEFSLDTASYQRADINSDGLVNSTDYLLIKRYWLYGPEIELPEVVIPDLEKDSTLDNSPEKISEYLKSNNLILKSSDDLSKNVSRIDVAANAVFYSGFIENIEYYYPAGDYSDLERFSTDSKYAEIAVNQGYMIKPTNGKFSPDASVTVEEVLRSFLYVLGYREFSDEQGYTALAKTIKLSDHITKSSTAAVTYGDYVQIAYNALHLTLVQCIENNEALSLARRDGFYIENTYIKSTKSKDSPIFKLANDGWDIFKGGGYKYGPSIMLNSDGSIDAWFASFSGLPGEVDYGVHRRSYDGGKTWIAETNAIMPTGATQDWNWACDPGVIKIGDWYYGAYTSTSWHDGVDNNLFIARSKTPEGTFMEKWTGSGWGLEGKPVIVYDGVKSSWGAGEGSFVVEGGKIYIYSTWTSENGDFTRVHSADANNENWPATLTYEGIAFERDNAEDSADVKYVDAYNSFISVSTSSRFTANCYINIRTSFDGKYFRKESIIKHTSSGSNLMTHIHNMGISSNETGHIDIFAQNYVGYAYQPEDSSWGNWPTRFVPIAWFGTDLYENPSNAPDFETGTEIDKTHSPVYGGVRLLSHQNSRLFRANSADELMSFYIQGMSNTGSWNSIPDADYLKVKFTYDPTALDINIFNRTIRMLVDEPVTVVIEYEGNIGYFTVVPNFADNSKPIAFFGETDIVTFTRPGEVKQPAFVAESQSGDYLLLWGNLSSYTDANTKDQPDFIKAWDQTVTLSGWDENIISVDTATGKITAKSVGTTTVTATYMGLSATITVVVEVV